MLYKFYKLKKLEMSMPSLCIVVVYFGEWPSWFMIYLESCKRNPDVNFLILTDCEVPEDKFVNINFVSLSKSEFNQLASQKLKLNINITSPYKLCDLRPAFGVIFEDYLKDFSFWGVSDIDLIYGNITRFITSNVLENYDIITVKKQYLAGHFTVFRNHDKFNRLYEHSLDYQMVFERNNKYFNIDECNFLWRELLGGASIWSLISGIDSMTHVVMRLHNDGIIRVYFGDHILEQDCFDLSGRPVDFKNRLFWENGRLTCLDSKTEFLYFHFHLLKREPSFAVTKWDVVPSKFFISNKGFSINSKF